jgi:predicted Zn-dependent protease
LKDILIKVIDEASQKFGAEYAEVRAQKLSKTMLTLKEDRVEAAKQGIENGAALRVLVENVKVIGKQITQTFINRIKEARN